MKFTLAGFEIHGVDGVAHVKFTAIVEGERIECDQPLSKFNKDDVTLLNAIADFCRTKIGEM